MISSVAFFRLDMPSLTDIYFAKGLSGKYVIACRLLEVYEWMCGCLSGFQGAAGTVVGRAEIVATNQWMIVIAVERFKMKRKEVAMLSC